MGWLRFYGAGLRHASKASWWLIGTISTLATFAVPGIAKFFGFADQDTVNTLLLLSVPVSAIICVVAVPFREAYRLNQEKELQLEEERKKHAEERRQWDAERAALQAQVHKLTYADPHRNAIRCEVEARIAECELLKTRIATGDMAAVQRLYVLEYQAYHYLQTHLPAYARFANSEYPVEGSVPHNVDFKKALARCEFRIARFKEILEMV